MVDRILKRVKEINYEHFHRLWLKAKNSDMKDVTGEEKQLVRIMLKHQDQYGEIFENPDMAGEYRGGLDSENNPFLHILLHVIMETQLENREPIEAYQFVLSMRNRGCTFHQAIHLGQAIFVHLLYDVLNHNIPFDWERYIFLLKKYKNRRPHKIGNLLKQEFKSVGHDSQECSQVMRCSCVPSSSVPFMEASSIKRE